MIVLFASYGEAGKAIVAHVFDPNHIAILASWPYCNLDRITSGDWYRVERSPVSLLASECLFRLPGVQEYQA